MCEHEVFDKLAFKVYINKMCGFFCIMISWAFICIDVRVYIPSLWVGHIDSTFHLLLNIWSVFIFILDDRHTYIFIL